MVAKKPKVATKRPSLKLDKPKEPVKPTPVVTQMVVEVEDDGRLSAPLETIEKDTRAVEEAAHKLEEDIDKELKTEEPVKPATRTLEKRETSAKAPEAGSEETEQKRKAVVKEFFKSDTGVTPEIATYKDDGGARSLLIWFMIIIGVAGLTGGGLTLAVRGMPRLPFLAAAPTPTPTPESLPTPTPTPSVNRADINLQVLNGGGVAGAGSKMKDFLEGKGYTVSAVGNADTFDYQNTEIQVKPGKETYLSLLESDLKTDYSLGTNAATLAEESSYDARVIVGKE